MLDLNSVDLQPSESKFWSHGGWVALLTSPLFCIIAVIIGCAIKQYKYQSELKLQNRLFAEWTTSSKMVFKQKYDDGLKRTPLHIAIQVNNLPLVDHLLKQYPTSTSIRDNQGNAPLHYAAAYANAAILELVIEHTPSPLPRNEYRLTPIDIASVMKPEHVKLLQNEGKYKQQEVYVAIPSEQTPLIT